MNQASWKSSPPRRSGLTLVEVLAGSLLLGGLLVSIVVANARLTTQSARAQRRAVAAEVADGLLNRLWEKVDEFPRCDQGPVEGRTGWSWRTRVVANADVEKLGGQIVALEVWDDKTAADGPAARVELVLPKQQGIEGDANQPTTQAVAR